MKTRNFVRVAVVVVLLGMLPTTHGQRRFFSDFNDGVPDWDVQPRFGSATEAGGRLSLGAQLPATGDDLGNSLTAPLWTRPQPIRNGETLEYRVDLIVASGADAIAGIEYASGAPTPGLYGFHKDGNQIFLAKVNLQAGTVALLFHEMTPIKHENVILSLSLTGVGGGVRIGMQVLDKDAGEAVLFERTVTDTPGVDTTVAQTWAPNLDPGAPYLYGVWHGLYLAQFTDGNQPEAEVVYDNFSYEYIGPFTRVIGGDIANDTGASGQRGFNGASWGDFDDDGLIDLFVTRVPPNTNILYRNQGDGTFLKLTEESIIHGDITSATGVWGDVDNDGDLDLFLPNAVVPGYERPPQDFFYRNQGGGTLTRVTEGEFVNDTSGSIDASWVDYDLDGFLDLFVANGGSQRNFLYHNEGDGTFTRITEGNPIVQDAHYSHGCSWADYDNDGDLDLFVANKNANNYLYRNDALEAGPGSFSRITSNNPIVAGADNSEAGAWADYDNDGDLDLLVLNFPPQQNILFRNHVVYSTWDSPAAGSFERITNAAFLSAGGYCADWADYDNDGHLDLIIVRSYQSGQRSLLYRNHGDGTFSETASSSLPNQPAEAAAWGDYDNDGFVDLFLTTSRTNYLCRNNGNSNHWLKLKLVGTASNRSAIGAKVRVKATIAGKTFWQLREVSTPGGFGKPDMRPNFGLGDAEVAETIRIEWPSGTVQELHNVAANQILTMTEPPKGPPADPFRRITTGEIVTDRAHSLGCAWGDYDGDGFLDLIVANGFGDANALYRNNGDGSFARISSPISSTIGDSDGCVWGDYDNDGDVDLFLANWGIPSFLFRNEGSGNFTRITSGSIAVNVANSVGCAWGDYDNDGFLDLLVANYSGRNEFLYRNNTDGSFAQVLSGPLVNSGGDTGFVNWADYDDDGWLDVLTTTSNPNGGQNVLFQSAGEGNFNRVLTPPSGPSDRGGADWGDYDNDGDLDLFIAQYGGLNGANDLLYRNDGNGAFTQILDDPIVTNPGRGRFGAWGDYDNDGWLDLFVRNRAGVHFLFYNNANGTFTRVMEGTLLRADEVDSTSAGGISWIDYDNDGFLDFFMNHGGDTAAAENALFHNEGNDNNWLLVACVGTASNRSAIGAKVMVKATINGKTFWQLRDITTGNGYAGARPRAHFGLGNATVAGTVRIEWPSGTVQELHNVAANQILTVTEPPRLMAEEYVGGELQFKIIGVAGMRYRIESSTNLEDWSPYTTLIADAREVLTGEGLGAGNSHVYRFFRVIQEQP